MVVSLGVLTVSTTDLDVVLVSNSLELLLLVAELGESDVDGGTETGSEVGWARGDVAEVVIVSELGLLLNASNSAGKALEDFTDIGALLHGDDSELILFVDPDKEGLGLVVEDAAGFGPVALEEGRLEVLVVTLEEEVVFSELLLLLSSHVAKRVVLALEVTGELGEGSDDLGFDLLSLLSGNSRAKWILSEVSTDTDTGGVDHSILINGELGAVELGIIHVADVLISGLVAVIVINNFIEKRSEGVVRIVRASVNTDTGLGPLASGEDGLLKCESKLIFLVLELLPDLLVKAAGEEGLGACGEVRQVSDLLGTLQVGANEGASGVSLSNLIKKEKNETLRVGRKKDSELESQAWLEGPHLYDSSMSNVPGKKRMSP